MTRCGAANTMARGVQFQYNRQLLFPQHVQLINLLIEFLHEDSEQVSDTISKCIDVLLKGIL